MHASHTDGKSRTKADSRQWENPKTWPILHQGIAGPIQSGSPPPPPPQLPALTSCGYTPSLPPPPPSVSWSSVEQPPFALSLSLSLLLSPALPASHHHPPSSSSSSSSSSPHLLSHHYDRSGSNAHYSRGREARVCPCVCLSSLSSPIH